MGVFAKCASWILFGLIFFSISVIKTMVLFTVSAAIVFLLKLIEIPYKRVYFFNMKQTVEPQLALDF